MLEVSTQILSPIGDDENVLPDFSYLKHRETFEAKVNSSLDISLRNQHGASIRHRIQLNWPEVLVGPVHNYGPQISNGQRSLQNFFGFMLRRIVEIFNRFCSISLDLNNFVRKYDEEILFEEDFGNELNTQVGFLIDSNKSEFNELYRTWTETFFRSIWKISKASWTMCITDFGSILVDDFD